jgi:hypothetical protein
MAQDDEKRSKVVKGIILRLGTIAAFLIVQAALLFGGAGTLNWLCAWVYFGISLVIVLPGYREYAHDVRYRLVQGIR